MNLPPFFLLLGDQRINLAHVQVIQYLPLGGPTNRVALDLGTRTLQWTPKSTAELDWFEAAIQLWRPGELPKRLEDSAQYQLLRSDHVLGEKLPPVARGRVAEARTAAGLRPGRT